MIKNSFVYKPKIGLDSLGQRKFEQPAVFKNFFKKTLVKHSTEFKLSEARQKIKIESFEEKDLKFEDALFYFEKSFTKLQLEKIMK